LTHSPRIDDDTAEACAAVLAWCLTASDRFVRDRATKGLVALLSDNVALTCELVRRFDDVDDLYVRERIMAAAYGVAMRSTDPEALAPLADLVYGLIFANGEPPAHILLRDYARGIIERALYLGADIDVDASLYEPPYYSEWPSIPEAIELEKLDPLREDPPSEPSDAERAMGWIHSSVMHMDFALYVIGTNSTPKSRHWLSVPNDEPIWRSEEDLQESFRHSLDPDMQETFDLVWAHARPRRGRSIETLVADVDAEAQDTKERPPPSTAEPDVARWLEEELPQLLEELFVSQLDDAQSAVYEQAKAARGTKAPRLNLKIIQRYVLWRVFDLGWTPERHGDLDREISRSASYAGAGRGSRKPERVGKKYQWIAYHEILAHISDRYQYWLPYDDAGPQNAYRGAWQLSVRDIDPSSLLTGASTDSTRPEGALEWWRHEADIASVDHEDHLEWLQHESDFPDENQQLRFTDPEDSSTWIKLQGLDIWQTPIPPGYDRHEVDHREIWLWAHGYFVGAADVAAFVSWATTVDFWNRWMPEAPRAYSLFLGELGWSLASDSLLADSAEPQRPKPNEGTRCPIPIQPAAFQYAAEGGGYDCSIVDSYELHRPNSRLVEAMDLRWTGHGADFVNADGMLVAFDPSARDAGASALLMREDDLERFLNETGSALVWAMTGAKHAYGPGWLTDAWAGALQGTGVATYEPTGLIRRRFTTSLQLPERDRDQA